MAYMHIQRTEIEAREIDADGSLKYQFPVSIFIGDGPDRERSTRWISLRFECHASLTDNLPWIQISTLQEAKRVLDDQIARLERDLPRQPQ